MKPCRPHWPSPGLDAVLRRQNPLAWDGVWDRLPYQGVAYAAPTVDYQQAYLRSAAWTLEDASLVLQSGGRAYGLWPLTVGGPPEGARLTSAGGGVMAPVFAADAPRGQIKKIVSHLIAFAGALCARQGLPALVAEQDAAPPLAGQGASEWHQQLLAAGASVSVQHDLYLDLGPDLAEIHANFRKGHKWGINVGLRKWEVFALDEANASHEVWAEFKQLHRDVAGRATRSDETWAAQFAMIDSGQAFLIGLRDPEDSRLVGGNFYQYSRDEGLLAVAAYDRTLFGKPLGHVAQQRGIEWMKARGLRWYKIGHRFYSQEQPAPTAKEVSIAHFKEGFASHMFCQYEFRLPANPAQLALD